MANQKHLAILERGINAWNLWRANNHHIKTNLSRINLSEVNLSRANLSRTDLTRTILSRANLCETNLSQANLREADLIKVELAKAKLNKANLIRSKLIGSILIGVNLREADLSLADLREANLEEADLREANLSSTYSSRVNLSKANLEKAVLKKAELDHANLSWTNLCWADLTGIRALGTNFEGAILTGACIEDWNTNSQTNLNNVICDYIYLKQNQQERRPHDPNKNFAPGDFARLFQKMRETVDLIFREGVNWSAFAYSLQKTQVLNEDILLTIQTIENTGDGVFIIRVGVPANTDKQKIEGNFREGYEFAQKALEGQYQAKIKDKDQEINRLFYLLNQREEVKKLMAEQPKVQQNFHNRVYGVAGNVEGNQNIYPSEQKNLAEAAAEIQEIIKQLTKTYQTESLTQKAVVAEETLKQIKGRPKLRQRVIGFLESGTLGALDKAIDNPIGAFIIEGIKGWQDVEGE